MASTSGIFESTNNGTSWHKTHQATGAGFPDSKIIEQSLQLVVTPNES